MTAAVDPHTSKVAIRSRRARNCAGRVPGERMVRIKNQTFGYSWDGGHRDVDALGQYAINWKIVRRRTSLTRLEPIKSRRPVTKPFLACCLPMPNWSFLDCSRRMAHSIVRRASIGSFKPRKKPDVRIEAHPEWCGFDWKPRPTRRQIKAKYLKRRYRIPKGNDRRPIAACGWGRLRSWIDKSCPKLADCTRAGSAPGLWPG